MAIFATIKKNQISIKKDISAIEFNNVPVFTPFINEKEQKERIKKSAITF